MKRYLVGSQEPVVLWGAVVLTLSGFDFGLTNQLLGVVIALALFLRRGSEVPTEYRLIAMFALALMLIAPTNYLFLSAGLVLIAALYGTVESPRLPSMSLVLGWTTVLWSVYDTGWLTSEIDKVSWAITGWLTQMVGLPGIWSATQSHLLLLVPTYLVWFMNASLASIRSWVVLLVIIVISLIVLLMNQWFWYGWMFLLVIFALRPRLFSTHLLKSGKIIGAIACMSLALLILGIGMRGSFRCAPSSISVGVVEGGLKSLELPSAQQIQAPQDALFGNLLQVLALYGFAVDTIAPADLKSSLRQLDVLVVINPTQRFPKSVQVAIQEYVQSGGALLVLGDHTDIGGIMEPINDLIGFTDIRLRFDSAIPMDSQWRWKACLRGGWHPLFHGRKNADFGISIGASLDIGLRAQPLVVGEKAFSDIGRPDFGESRLGDMEYNIRKELRGGLVLVAEQRYGKGLVQVWGDTAGFQDTSLTDNHHFVASLVHQLSCRRPVSISRLALGCVVLLLMGVALFWLRSCPYRLALLSLMFAVGYHGLGWLGSRLWSCQVDIKHSDFAVLDRSHGALYPQPPYEKGLSTLSETFLRVRVPLLAAEDFSKGIEKNPRWWVIVAPLVPYSSEEVDALEQYVQSGGSLMVISGFATASSVHSLLERFGMSISQVPLGAAHNSRVVSSSLRQLLLGAPEKSGKGDNFRDNAPYDAEISFKESFSVRGDDATQPLVQCWGHTVVQYKQIGKGSVVLIGDSRFGLDENLGWRDNRNERNIRLLMAILERKW